MAVVANMKNKKYYVHRIILPDGSVFVYSDVNKNAELTGSDVHQNKQVKGPDISSASTNIIPNPTEKVNTSDENYLKAVKNGDMKTALTMTDSDGIRFALPLDSKSKKELGNKKFHNLRYIEKIADNVGGRTFDENRSGGSTKDTSAIYNVSDLFDFVKRYDEEFKPIQGKKRRLTFNKSLKKLCAICTKNALQNC